MKCFKIKSKTKKKESRGGIGKNMSMIYKKKLSVLIVDDDPSCCTLLMGIIQMAGGFAYVAETGEEAVNLHLNGDSFNLILMDYEMPLMNGILAAKKLRDMKVASMIVGMTSHEDERVAFMEAGVDYCLAKPLTFGKLASTIDHLKNA